jgi:hypothetical protein
MALVQRLIHGVILTSKPKDYCVVRIDNWFGERWLNFSGKTLGALGVHKKPNTTFPPFVPSRIRSCTLFTWNSKMADYANVEEFHSVHKWQHSGANLQNFVGNTYPDACFFWFSGNTKENHRGSLMGYVSSKGECWTWYLEFQRKGNWRRSKATNITPEQIDFFLSKCLGHTRGACPS